MTSKVTDEINMKNDDKRALAFGQYIGFCYDKRNQYRSSSGNLTMYVKLMRT